MKTKIFLALIAASFLFAMGCNRIACERMAECVEDWYGYEMDDDAIDDCVDDVNDEDAGCEIAFRKAARCLNKEDCDAQDCEDEVEDAMDKCDDIF